MNCIHYWKIEPPDGPTSSGACQYCGEAKVFQNGDHGNYIYVDGREVTMSDRPSWVIPLEKALKGSEASRKARQ